MIVNVNVNVNVRMWACRCPARALAPVSLICRLIESLWDLDLNEQEWEGHGHEQAKDKIGLGHLKFMRKHLSDYLTVLIQLWLT